MTLGLTVNTADGKLQINEHYFNMFLVDKQLLTLVNAAPPNANQSTYFTYNAIVPLSQYPNCVFAVRHELDSNLGIPLGTRVFEGSLYIDAYTKTNGLRVYLYVFSYDKTRPVVTDGSNYGMRIRDTQNNVIFDSRAKYLKILHAVRQNFGSEIANNDSDERNLYTANISGLAGKTLAYFIPAGSFVDYLYTWTEEETYRGYDRVGLASCMYITNGVLKVDYKRFRYYIYITRTSTGSLPPDFRYSSYTLCSFLIDVTNY